MRKIKIFTDNDAGGIERKMNHWLIGHKSAIIHNVLQSECCLVDGTWSLTITIFYYEGEGA